MNNSLYRESFMHMPVGYGLHKIVLGDNGLPVDYEFVEVNGKYEEATGLHADDIIGRRLTEVLPGVAGEDLRRVAAFGYVALNGSSLETEQLSQQNGKLYRISAFSPEKGYFVTLYTDITDDRAKLAKAAESEKKLKRYMDAVPVAVLVSNGAHIAEVNPAACALTGYSEEELLRLRFYKLFAQKSRLDGIRFIRTLLGDGGAEHELQVKTKDGGTKWLSVKGRALSDNRYLVFGQDVTSYQVMADSLVDSERLYRAFIDASGDLIYLKDEELRYRIVNQALQNKLGRKNSDMIGKTDADFMPADAAEKIRGSDKAVIDSKAGVTLDLTVGDRNYLASKFPVSIGADKTGVGAYVRDVTQEKKQEASLNRTMERHRMIASALTMTFRSTREQLEYALQEALSLTGSQYGAIYLYDETRRELTLCARTGQTPKLSGPDEAKKTCMLDEAGVWGDVIRTLRPIIRNDFADADHLKGGYSEVPADTRDFMSVPILISGKAVAAVGLAGKSGGYDDTDVSELSLLMNGVWVAVDRRSVQDRMESLYSQTQSMFNEHDAVMLLLKPRTGRIIDANPAAVSFYGYTRSELLELSIDDILMEADEETVAANKDSGEKHRFYSAPHRMKNGDTRMVDVFSCPITYNRETVIFSIIFDVTEREKAFNEIKYLSFHDHLTGLYNRRYFDSMLKLMNDKRYLPLTIVMADVNGLKLVNDSFGHAEGDELLKKAAELILEGCRKNDISARIGGDEFAIVLPNTDFPEADKIVRRIKRHQSKYKIKQLDLSLSFGYAVKHSISSDVELVVSEAENEMYKNKARESAMTRNKTVSIIMNTLYEKCDGEMTHAMRVGKISGAIASAMGLPPEQVGMVSEAGLLHDIGKIGVDANILNKQSTYSTSEREEIKKHPESGWRILSNSDEYSNLAEYILYHHETPDGTGYPRGIKGASIPLESRIISVAEAYDAMTHAHAYRDAMSKAEATAELKRNVGTQFDAEIVDVFVKQVADSLELPD